MIKKNTEYSILLKKASLETLYVKRLKAIATEVFKTMNDLNPVFMKEMFQLKVNRYGLRDDHKLIQPNFNTITYGLKSFSYYGAHIWNLLPVNVKNATSINEFKNLLKSWEGPGRCQCSLCNIGFM